MDKFFFLSPSTWFSEPRALSRSANGTREVAFAPVTLYLLAVDQGAIVARRPGLNPERAVQGFALPTLVRGIG